LNKWYNYYKTLLKYEAVDSLKVMGCERINISILEKLVYYF